MVAGPTTPKTTRRYVPATDLYRADVEEIQAYANALFKTNHHLISPTGQEIGKTNGIMGRYGVIRRALVDWGFSKDQLKSALLLASKDPWWVDRKIRDTVTILRKLNHVQRWVDTADRGEQIGTAGKWDKKQTSLAFSQVMDADGKLDRSKLIEESF